MVAQGCKGQYPPLTWDNSEGPFQLQVSQGSSRPSLRCHKAQLLTACVCDLPRNTWNKPPTRSVSESDSQGEPPVKMVFSVNVLCVKSQALSVNTALLFLEPPSTPALR